MSLVATTGMLAGLISPLSVQADQGSDVVEILASAAIAYVVVDAVGGFDDKRKHKHKHKQKHRYTRDRHRHERYSSHRSMYRGSWERDRHGRDWRQVRRSSTRHHHREQVRHGRSHRADRGRGPNRSGHQHHDRHYRYRAYH